MEKLINILIENIKIFARFLLAHLSEVVLNLWRARDGISAKNLATDAVAVIRSVGLLSILNVIAFCVFVFLPQGKDVLLIVIEDISSADHHVGNLIWLLIGVFLWSIVSEYASRYAVYVTDNSGKVLTAERVRWRKAVQKAVSEMFLLLPYFIILIGLAVNYFQETAITGNTKKIGFLIPFTLVYLLLNGVAYFYFDIKRRARWRKSRSWMRILFLPDLESDWCGKLHGIYNDYVFTLRKPSNFLNEPYRDLLAFSENYKFLSPHERDLFPKDSSKISPNSLIPKDFVFKEFSEDTADEGLCRWVFWIPNSFYKTLHKQLLILSGISIVVFLFISFLKFSFYQVIGAPGLVTLAFACWCGIYIGVIYLDYAVFRSGPDKKVRIRSNISIRAILLIMLICSSFFNDDHPVRYTYGETVSDHVRAGKASTFVRPGLRQHFEEWVDDYTKDLRHRYRRKRDTAENFYPVVFVCAEGGAARTGAYSALLLSRLQDELVRENINFKESVFACSGVSGGSLGVSLFNALAYIDPVDERREYNYSTLTRKFFNEDFLSPVLGKMFYGEVINLVLPWHVRRFDRAIALEDAWETAYSKIIPRDHTDVFSGDCLQVYSGVQRYPAMFINTSEVETGLQCWLSNVVPDTSMFLWRQRDLLGNKIKGSINYSTMVNFSARFPLFSPACEVRQNADKKLHYVDGGYVENTGAATMSEILRVLKPVFDNFRKNKHIDIRPYVLMIQYGEEENGYSNINFANEFSEILYGIYNTRRGRTRQAAHYLKRQVEDPTFNGKLFPLKLEADRNQIPLNWVLSSQSLGNLQNFIDTIWVNRAKQRLNEFIYCDSTCERCCK